MYTTADVVKSIIEYNGRNKMKTGHKFTDRSDLKEGTLVSFRDPGISGIKGYGRVKEVTNAVDDRYRIVYLRAVDVRQWHDGKMVCTIANFKLWENFSVPLSWVTVHPVGR